MSKVNLDVTADGRDPVLEFPCTVGDSLLNQVVPELAGDLGVLFAVFLHLLGPPGPVRGLPEYVLVQPEAVAPCLQRVAPDEILRELGALEVVVADVRVAEAGQDESVDDLTRRLKPEDLAKNREVEVDDVVPDDGRGSLEDPQGLPMPDGLVGRCEDVRGHRIADHDGVDAGVSVEGVGLDVEDDGVHLFPASHFAIRSPIQAMQLQAMLFPSAL
jgi:hypothetical protein